MERELGAPVALCLANGQLNRDAVGWSRRPWQRSNLYGRMLRKKRWNYWAITSNTHLFSATISHLDYAGVIFVYLADLQTGQLTEATRLVPFGRGCVLGEMVEDAAHYSGGGWEVKMQPHLQGVTLQVELADFQGVPLRAAFDITMPPQHESLNVVVPWDARTFQFTSKQNCLPANGSVMVNGRTIGFDGAQSFACLDFGRGIWPRHCRWNWGSGSGVQDGRVVGLNLGGQWTDGTGSTENGVCIDGRLHKYDTDFIWEYDKAAYMKPWHIHDPAGRLALTFTPFMERVATSNVLLIRSEVHQMLGHYNGWFLTDEGERIVVSQLMGWAEDHEALW